MRPAIGASLTPRAHLLFSRKQPLDRFSEFLMDVQENFRPNFLLTALDVRKVSLANSNPLRELFLTHIKPS
jgi:hypothetical protein